MFEFATRIKIFKIYLSKYRYIKAFPIVSYIYRWENK
tara:strand:- start:121 stop:231 length:111 start_codon:yes stop_codon:yes gene_type:complete